MFYLLYGFSHGGFGKAGRRGSLRRKEIIRDSQPYLRDEKL